MRYAVAWAIAVLGCSTPFREGDVDDASVIEDEDTESPDTSSPPVVDSERAPDTPSVDTASAVDTSTSAPETAPEPTPSAECSSYCTCMIAVCTKYAGYPFADEKACLAKCAAYSPPQLKCFAYFCADAKKTTSASTREHSCRHAWGAWGLEECP
jgi:hypothetical protein